MSNIINISQQIKQFKGKEIVPFSTVYNDQAVLELGYLPSILRDFISSFKYPEVLHGFDIFDLSVNNNFCTFYINNGIAVIDDKIVSIKSTQLLSILLNQSWPINNGYILIDLCIENGQIFLKTFFVHKSSGEIYPTNYEFDTSNPHLIIGVIKVGQNQHGYYLKNVTREFKSRAIYIKNKSFYVYCIECSGGGINTIGELYDTFRDTEFINVVFNQTDEKIEFFVINLENYKLNYNPTAYNIADQKLISHLTGINNQLLQIETKSITNSILQSRTITTNKNINQSLQDEIRVHFLNGLILYPNINFTINLPNQIVFNNDIPMNENDIVTIYYFTL